MVEQPTGGCDHHVGAAIELAVLLVVGHPADQQRHRELMVLAENFEMLGDLRRQLASRREDQRARHAGAGSASLEPHQHRQDEGGGLAGAGLGDAKHVATRDGMRHGSRLNGSGSVEACRRDGGQNLWT